MPEPTARERQMADTTALIAARAAFWLTLAELTPDVTTGDLDPIASHDFDVATEAAQQNWLLANRGDADA